MDSKKEGEIRIKTRNAEEGIIVVIEDNGTGMSREIQDRIFEPFFTTRDVGGRGAGLGLWTVYKTIKAHQGEVKVHSTPGEGTSFEIYLPLHKSSQKLKREGDHERISLQHRSSVRAGCG